MKHACHFPYAVALTNHKAATLVNKVIKYFSLFGLCKQILHDLGSDFTAELFTVLLHSFGITQLKSAVCHPQTNYVEKLHRMLMKMFRAYVDQQKSSWDKDLDLALFACREVPVAEYGFSSFELLFGRKVEELLDIIFDTWWANPNSYVSKHVIAHMLEIRNNMQTALNVVHN